MTKLSKNVSPRHSLFALALGAMVAMGASVTPAQEPFTAADSGWVPLFNGYDFTGLYSRNYGQEIQRPPHPVWVIEHPHTDTATIYVSGTATNVQGHLGTDNNSYKHYRVRVSYRFNSINNNHNAGLTYHTDESVPRMNNNWPRSIESQMKQNETGSAFSIAQLAFTTRTSANGAGSNYNPEGNIVQACETGCNGRWYRGNPFIAPHANGETRWMRKEVIVRGADSAIHMINDTVVFRLWNMRVVNNSGQMIAAHDSGAIAIQSEGALIRYRHWDIMEIPPTTPTHYLHRLFLDAPSGPINLTSGAPLVIRWRSIGTLPGVKIESRHGSGSWQTIAESVPDTGAYHWTVPQSVSGTTEFRISSAEYVWGDSTVGKPASLRPGQAARASVTQFVVQAGKVLLPEGYEHAEIRDVSGRMVRTIQGAGAATAEAGAGWDLTDASGSAVKPGLYFLRISGPQGETNGRVLIP